MLFLLEMCRLGLIDFKCGYALMLYEGRDLRFHFDRFCLLGLT